MKLYQFDLTINISGHELNAIVVCKTWADAANLFKVTLSRLKTYGTRKLPDITKMSEFYMVVCWPNGGELCTHDYNNLNKVMKMYKWEIYISEFNKAKYKQILKETNESK